MELYFIQYNRAFAAPYLFNQLDKTSVATGPALLWCENACLLRDFSEIIA